MRRIPASTFTSHDEYGLRSTDGSLAILAKWKTVSKEERSRLSIVRTSAAQTVSRGWAGASGGTRARSAARRGDACGRSEWRYRPVSHRKPAQNGTFIPGRVLDDLQLPAAGATMCRRG